MDEQDLERMYQSAAKNAVVKSLRFGSKTAWKIAKFCAKKSYLPL